MMSSNSAAPNPKPNAPVELPNLIMPSTPTPTPNPTLTQIMDFATVPVGVKRMFLFQGQKSLLPHKKVRKSSEKCCNGVDLPDYQIIHAYLLKLLATLLFLPKLRNKNCWERKMSWSSACTWCQEAKKEQSLTVEFIWERLHNWTCFLCCPPIANDSKSSSVCQSQFYNCCTSIRFSNTPNSNSWTKHHLDC